MARLRRAGANCVAEDQATQQTRLLIAVRDNRDRAAFSELFDFYAPRVKAMLMRSSMSSAQADDILQDVMLAIWRKAHLFDPSRASASAWIYRVARNRMIDVIRKESRAVPPELYEEPAVPENQTAELAIAQETEFLRVALGRLPPAQREMIERVYLGELTHQEVGHQTDLPVGTIKSRVRLALEKLRHELKTLRTP